MISTQNELLPGSFFIRTFGCQMNSHDSEHIAGVLEAVGCKSAPHAEAADLIIFNTCCVRRGAEERVWGNLSTLASSYDEAKVVAVCGCMAERYGVDILRRFPGVRLVFGLDSLPRLPELLQRSSANPLCDLGDINKAQVDDLSARRGSAARAWVPVSHGCDNNCAYCVVPLVRGRERSRPQEEVLAEIDGLAREGVIEVTLLGQNVNSYARDLRESTCFARLLEEAAAIPGIRRVKFETSHPGDLGDDILMVMGEIEQICEYLHLPVQSGSNRILKLMNRGYDREYYMERAARARELVTGLTLSTDIIVGFPGETERDFAETLDLVRSVEFDSAYMFMYSPRAETAAFELNNDVPEEDKRLRLAELQRVQDEITSSSLSKNIGRSVEVLVEESAPNVGQVVGRSRGHRVVVLPAEGAPIDSLVNASIVGSGGHSLRGRVERIIRRP